MRATAYLVHIPSGSGNRRDRMIADRKLLLAARVAVYNDPPEEDDSPRGKRLERQE